MTKKCILEGEVMKSVKKIITVIGTLLFTTLIYAQSLRDYVCIVRGNLSEENKTFLNEIKSSLERNGYTYYAGYVNAFLQGTFGSGFIWYGPDGKPYIVTNRHVISDYETVNITFENEDGSVSEFKELKIQFVDDDVDMALIALPASFKKSGLSFVSKKPSDGDDVFSAGFPGLAGEPSWQLGKGVVSNSSAKVKELLNPDISTIIQHTAQIDGGNSGGPLLVRDSSVKAGYKVCGINTWRAIARQNTNFAIPAAAIESTVTSNYIKKDKTGFDSRSIAFIKAASDKDDFTGLVPYISNSMISKFGEKALKDVLSKSSTTVRSYISDVFESNPLDGLRYSLAYTVWSKMETDSHIDIGEVSDEATGKNVKFSVGEESFSSFWIEEHGTWKLSEFDGIKTDKKLSNKDKPRNKSGSIFSMEDPYIFSICGGYARNITENDNGFYLDIAYRLHFVSIGFSLLSDSVTSEKEENFSNYKTTVKNNPIGVGPFLQLRLPLQFNRILIMPYGEVRAGVAIIPDFANSGLTPFFVGIGGGLEFAYNTEMGFSPFIGAKFLSNMYMGEKAGTYSANNFVIYAGIKLREK